jgi:hypothetical protein
MRYRVEFPDIYRQLAAEVAKLGQGQRKQEAQNRLQKLLKKGGRWPSLSAKEAAELDVFRFFLRINLNNETNCWEWDTSSRDNPYGIFRIRKTQLKAHVVSYALFTGPVPEDLCVCHTCDNPPCVNPDHLFLGTQNDNIKDCWGKGRGRKFPSQNGESNVVSKLTEENVLYLRNHYKPPMSAWAKKYGVTEATLYHALKGDTWSHL